MGISRGTFIISNHGDMSGHPLTLVPLPSFFLSFLPSFLTVFGSWFGAAFYFTLHSAFGANLALRKDNNS